MDYDEHWITFLSLFYWKNKQIAIAAFFKFEMFRIWWWCSISSTSLNKLHRIFSKEFFSSSPVPSSSFLILSCCVHKYSTLSLVSGQHTELEESLNAAEVRWWKMERFMLLKACNGDGDDWTPTRLEVAGGKEAKEFWEEKRVERKKSEWSNEELSDSSYSNSQRTNELQHWINEPFHLFYIKIFKSNFMCSPSWMGRRRRREWFHFRVVGWLAVSMALHLNSRCRRRWKKSRCDEKLWVKWVEPASWKLKTMSNEIPLPTAPLHLRSHSSGANLWTFIIKLNWKVIQSTMQFLLPFFPRLNTTQAFPFLNHQWIQTQKISIYFQVLLLLLL